MSSKATVFVLVPGSFCAPEIYHLVTDILRAKGYEVAPTRLLSASDRSPEAPATLEDDAQHIHNTIKTFLDQDKDVVMAMNSYGGYPGSEAVRGLTRADRAGQPGGSLRALVYLASFLPQIGVNVTDALGGSAPGESNPGDAYLLLDAETTPAAVFNDLPEEQQRLNFKVMHTHSSQTFFDKATYEGYKHVPSTFLVPERDLIIAPALQYAAVERANKELEQEGSSMRVKLRTIDAGHAPMISKPDEVAQILLDAAGLSE